MWEQARYLASMRLRFWSSRSISRHPPVSDFIRGAVRLRILHHAAEEAIHGAWIAEELAHHGYRISPGTLYPTLHRMEAEGLLVSAQETVDGRVLRTYRITDEGRRELQAQRRSLAELAREVLPNQPDTLHAEEKQQKAEEKQ